MSKVAVIGIVGNSAFLPVEKFHEGGETVVAKSLRLEWGGKGCNQAVAAARMGAEVSFLAAIGGADEQALQSFFQTESIRAVLVKKQEPTAFACIITDKSGANHVTVYHGASLSAEDVACFESAIQGADVLLLNNEVDEAVNLAAAKIAEKYGTRIILNPAPERNSNEELLKKVYLFTPNEHEAKGLENYQNVIQTLGSRGCWIKSENKIVPSVKVKVVDTTGAGDTFNGVLAAELSMGKDVQGAVEKAVKAAGISVTRAGVMAAIPTRQDLI